jgi:hypothetical protein
MALETRASAFHAQHFQNGVRPSWAAVLHRQWDTLAPGHTLEVGPLPSLALCRHQNQMIQLDVAAVLTIYDPFTGKVRSTLIDQHQPDPTVGGHPAPTEGAAMYLLATAGLRPNDTLRQLAAVARPRQLPAPKPPAMSPERKRKAVHTVLVRLAEGDPELAHRCPKMQQRVMNARQGTASPATRRCLLSPEAPAALQALLKQ